MGLDSIEILMKVENTFGISIPDREAEKIITVCDFHSAVWRHLEGKHSDKCKSQLLYYKLRKSFFDTFNFTRKDFTLSTSMNNIFPQNNRRQLYLDFAKVNKIELPKLTLIKPWATFLSLFGLFVIIGGLVMSIILIYIFDYSKWALLIPVGGMVITYYVSKMLNPKRIVIEPDTIKDFTKKVLSLNYASLTHESGANRTEVESVINHIIADMAGLELDEITPEKKLGDDLGIN